MWKLFAILIPLCMLLATPVYASRIAGGMVYQTNEGIDQAPEGIMGYLAGHDEEASVNIIEKEKGYYAASIDKTRARLELAGARVGEANLSGAERSMAYGRLDAGAAWLDDTMKAIRAADDKASFDKAVSYKGWHAVKMLPSAAEGYAIACSMQRDPEMPDGAKALASQAKATFVGLLNLDKGSDFEAAEKARLEAFDELKRADEMINKAGGYR